MLASVCTSALVGAEYFELKGLSPAEGETLQVSLLLYVTMDTGGGAFQIAGDAHCGCDVAGKRQWSSPVLTLEASFVCSH